ncbi:MAG: hypothetical protein KAW12_03020 [Candidatus Aminicenantes bacterium]|nr:hypothetical protein [Candidatus Aminicenantes bacterium]
MKKLISSIVILLVVFALPLCAQEEQEPIREEVQVVNVEVPVRVFYKKQPVDNLTKENFKLYEGKKQQTITSFKIVRNKIKPGELSTAAVPGRYFVLVFRVTQYNEQFRDGIKYIFDNVLTENDRLMIFANNKSLLIDRIGDKANSLSRVNDLVQEQAHSSRAQLISYLQRLEQEVAKTKFKLALRGRQPNSRHIQDFLKKFLRAWKEYKKRQLMPNMDKFYYFAKHLEGIKLEKWVINFYQVELFPNIAMTGEMRRSINRIVGTLLAGTSEDIAHGRIIRNQLNEIDKEMSVAIDFPAEDISKLFYKVDAVFHSIFMRSMVGVVSQDVEYRRVATDLENCLRGITRATGGTLVASNNIKEAVDGIGAKENICYLLTYAPSKPKKIGKIKIKVSGGKKYKVRYDDNMRADYIKEYMGQKETKTQTSTIQITKLAYDNQKLHIGVDSFVISKTGKGPQGRVGIHITITNAQGTKIYDTGKPLTTKQNTIAVSIPFKLSRGKYDIVVDVKDFFTGKVAKKFIQTRVR